MKDDESFENARNESQSDSSLDSYQGITRRIVIDSENEISETQQQPQPQTVNVEPVTAPAEVEKTGKKCIDNYNGRGGKAAVSVTYNVFFKFFSPKFLGI